VPTVLRNAQVYSAAGPEISAVVIDDGVIAWLGTEDAVSVHAGPGDEVIDLQGALVTPAFVDAHVHCTATGLAATSLDLSDVQGAVGLLDRVAAFAARSDGSVILGHGWDDADWTPAGLPTVAELDRAGRGRPLYLSRVDGHSALVSAAFAGPGADEALVSGAGHDKARTAALEKVSAAGRRAAQRAALVAAAAAGIGCIHEMAGPVVSSADDLAGLLELAAAADAPGVQVIGYWGELGGVETAQALGAAGAAGDLFCDGSLGSRTAALHHPYTDAAPPGSAPPMPRLDPAQIAEHVLACTGAGLQAGFHAIGDAAVDAVLDGMEIAIGRAVQVRAAAHRIEHAEMCTDAGRLAAAGLVASVQPMFASLWGGPGALYERRVGPDRAATMNDFRALLNAGAAVALGSDSPVTPFDPWGAVRAAAYHPVAAASISTRAAFAAHTRGGWRAARRDGDGRGTIAVGAPATLAVWEGAELVIDVPDERVARWSTDPRAAVAGLPDVAPGRAVPRCLRTIVDGRTVYRAEA
jgi:predicted amidohydrolase YtcJ